MGYKKIYAFILSIILTTTVFCGCDVQTTKSDSAIDILCTSYPLYDWVMNITDGSSSVKVGFLLKNGVDIHSFQPTADDIIKIKTSKLFVYNGGSSESYLTDILRGEEINSIAALDVVENSLISSEHTHDGEHHTEYDEHVWLSIKNAIKICEEISNQIIALDPENTALYESNTNVYIAKLRELDAAYSQTATSSARRSLVLADRYPFSYLMNDYGIICHSAFPGCSDETEASFATILSLAEKVKELELSVVLTTDGTNNAVAETVIKICGTENIEILSLNSLQTITEKEINEGKTYLSAMTENLEILRKTLN